jgi:hypothetical protein
MIETDGQRRWWFATHPEYSWSRAKVGQSRPKEEARNPDKVTPEQIDAYVEKQLKHEADSNVIAILEELRVWFGTAFSRKPPAEQYELLWGDEPPPEGESDTDFAFAQEKIANDAQPISSSYLRPGQARSTAWPFDAFDWARDKLREHPEFRAIQDLLSGRNKSPVDRLLNRVARSAAEMTVPENHQGREREWLVAKVQECFERALQEYTPDKWLNLLEKYLTEQMMERWKGERLPSGREKHGVSPYSLNEQMKRIRENDEDRMALENWEIRKNRALIYRRDGIGAARMPTGEHKLPSWFRNITGVTPSVEVRIPMDFSRPWESITEL